MGLLLIWCGLLNCVGVEKPAIVWNQAGSNRVIVEVTGLAAKSLDQAQWQKVFSVYAQQGDLTTDLFLPSMAGMYRATAKSVQFIPQYPLQRGVQYRAVFNPAEAKPITSVFRLPATATVRNTSVTQIYPTADALPENLLKFYVHFSAPMSRGRIYEHIHLQTEAGDDVELPFLELDEELWNPEMTRLTLFIDPGRIKREILPLEEVGPSLEAGKQYTLLIDSDWQDATGAPLKEPFRKEFRVLKPDRDSPDPEEWNIRPPNANTREPLVVKFGESMDHALAHRLIRVHGTRPIDGTITLSNQESAWNFTPRAPWQPGAYSLLIQTTIEDLAGNNIGKPFEVDLSEGAPKPLSNTTVSVTFKIK